MNEIEKAINHFEYGVSHDIFSEPVITYAKLAIEALQEKQEREKMKCENCIYYWENRDDEYLSCGGEMTICCEFIRVKEK